MEVPDQIGLDLGLLNGEGDLVSQAGIPDPSIDDGWALGSLQLIPASGEERVELEGVCAYATFDFTNCGEPPSVPWEDQAAEIDASADGDVVAMLGFSGALAAWRTDGTRIAGPVVIEDPAPLALAVSPDGGTVAVSGIQGVTTFDGRTLEPQDTLDVTWATTLRFSPDGSTLGVASHTTETRLYDTDRWQYRELGVHSVALDLTEGARRVASLDADGFLRLWDGETLRTLQSVPMERMHLRRVDTARWGFIRFIDDNHVLTVDEGALLVISFDSNELIEVARSRLTRELTAEECAQYQLDDCAPAG